MRLMKYMHTGTDAGRALFILWSFMAVPVGCTRALAKLELTIVSSDS